MNTALLEEENKKTSFFAWLKSIYTGFFAGNTRMTWIDYARAVSIMVVVYGHTATGVAKAVGGVAPAILYVPQLYNHRMAVFFLVSGMFIQGSISKRGYKGFIWNRFATLLYPYFLWGALQLTTQILLSGQTNTKRDWTYYLYLIYNPREVDQFWYLYALVSVAVMFALTYHFLKIRGLWQVALGLVLRYFAPMVQDYSAPYYLMYFYVFTAVGYVLTDEVLKRDLLGRINAKAWTLGLLPVFIASQWYWHSAGRDNVDNMVYMLITFGGVAMSILVCYLLSQWGAARWMRFIGYHSLYIYLVHIFIVSGLRIVATKVLHFSQPIPLIIIGIVLGLTLPILFYHLALRFGAWWLFSCDKYEMDAYKRPKPKPTIQSA